MFNPLSLYLNGEIISKYKNDNLEKISQKKYQSPPPFKTTHLYTICLFLLYNISDSPSKCSK